MSKNEEEIIDDNAAWYPPENEQRAIADVEEVNAISSSVAILDEFFADLDADIETLRGVDYIAGVNPGTSAENVKETILVMQQTKAHMVKYRKKYEQKYKQYIKTDADEA